MFFFLIYIFISSKEATSRTRTFPSKRLIRHYILKPFEVNYSLIKELYTNLSSSLNLSLARSCRCSKVNGTLSMPTICSNLSSQNTFWLENNPPPVSFLLSITTALKRFLFSPFIFYFYFYEFGYNRDFQSSTMIFWPN